MPARDSRGRFIKRSQTDSEPRNDGAYWTRPTPLAMPRQRVVHRVTNTRPAVFTTRTGDK